MKLRKALSALLFGVGCAVSFVGTLALVLPCVSNNQLQLVLQSFEMPSSNLIVHAVNATMSYALHHGWQVLGVGLLAAITGGILLALCSRSSRIPLVQEDVFRRPVSVSIPVQPEAPPARNPFAEITYDDLPKPMPSPAVQHVLHHEPLLEPNRIEEAEPAAPIPSAAVQAGAPSQSGSRIITRTVMSQPETIVQPVPEPEETPIPEPVVPETSAVSHPPVQPGSRIRSTMGQHRKW